MKPFPCDSLQYPLVPEVEKYSRLAYPQPEEASFPVCEHINDFFTEAGASYFSAGSPSLIFAITFFHITQDGLLEIPAFFRLCG